MRAQRQQGVPADRLVAVETDGDSLRVAAADGLVTVPGSSTSDAVLREAEVTRARAIVVAPPR